MNLPKRLPKLEDIYPVFGLITLLIYGWGLYAFFWILPSWLNFLTLPELVGILAYNFLVHFLESLTLLAILLAFSFFFPRVFRFDFLFRGGLSALWVAVLFMTLQLGKISYQYVLNFFLIWILLAPVVHYFLGRIPAARTAVRSITERASVFLYIFPPLTMFALIIFVFRNF